MNERFGPTARLAATLVALAITLTLRSTADAKCTQSEVRADRDVGPMVGFLPAPPPTPADRATAQSRLREIRAMVAPYRHGGRPPRDIALYTAAHMLVPAQSPPALAERGPRFLLYGQAADATMQLEAVEFAFARDTPVRDLDAILPRSIARWHQLTRHCTAPPAFMWIATVFPYAHDDGAIWRRLEVPKFVEVAPRL